MDYKETQLHHDPTLAAAWAEAARATLAEAIRLLESGHLEEGTEKLTSAARSVGRALEAAA